MFQVQLGMGSVSMASWDCLPDELLVEILSFLPTKQAASTSVLAKRWRTLFAVRQNLDFDDSDFLNPEEVGEDDMDEINESFRNFVDRTLALQGAQPINKLSLKCGEEPGEDHVDGWIINTLDRGVSELQLCLTFHMRTRLPSNLFVSKTLVKLILGKEFCIDCVPSDTFLPVLKIMFLHSVWFMGTEFSDVLLAGCPALEDLTIHHKYFFGTPEIISSKTLKRLSIISKCAEDVHLFEFISLDAPNLVDLFYADYARRKYHRCNLDSLVKATLDLHFLEPEECDEPFEPNVTVLMNGIRNVKKLQLTFSATEVISECCKGGLPVFKNLLELVFFGNKEKVWKELLPLVLKNSPNLKCLILSALYPCTYGHEFDGIPIPQTNKINFLGITCYQGTENELKHVSHFLLKMERLQLLQVHFSMTLVDSKRVQLTEDLLKLPRASSTLTMQFV
ncbi:PREDICTED: putative F-box/LRR-repeat protein At3g44810 [Camelina sativa]|uniref:F-box/LRR-repeat protein At3g44810 n=1 Tax=Camelina sativa TaxID=90675 RepID=A0ABM1RMC2_CAMSA|nr:PREDICTED: putative F-box/LRR-repeat protein At3g44810 [Camelina sativa]